MSTAEIATRQEVGIARADEEWSVARIVEQATKIQQCMAAVMKKGEHYGVIPGTQGRNGEPPKPTLLKPGAEKLCLMFRLCPEYETLRADQTSSLVSYTVRCTLIHIPTGNRIATGLGSCNSREKKYVRPADKKCPKCGKETLILGKPEYEKDPAFKGGWVCYQKKGGCGAKFKPGDEAIDKQPAGLADPSDLDNTILKMACKRALIAAVLNGTAASDCFTQDLEDLAAAQAEYAPPAAQPPKGGPRDMEQRRAQEAPPVDVASAPANDPPPGDGPCTDEQYQDLMAATERLKWKTPKCIAWAKKNFGKENPGDFTYTEANAALAMLEGEEMQTKGQQP